ncbi:MAG TPA: hypothetical protein VGE04_10315 [Chloroflexia bacterium]
MRLTEDVSVAVFYNIDVVAARLEEISDKNIEQGHPKPPFVILNAVKMLVPHHPSISCLLGKLAAYYKKGGTSR